MGMGTFRRGSTKTPGGEVERGVSAHVTRDRVRTYYNVIYV